MEQLLQRNFVMFGAWQLIRHRPIPVQAMSLEALQYGCAGAGFGAWRVEIFHAQQPSAAVLLHADIAAYGSKQGASMQTPRRGRGEATDSCSRDGVSRPAVAFP